MKSNAPTSNQIESKYTIVPTPNRIVGPKLVRFDSPDVIEEEATKGLSWNSLARRLNLRYRGCSEAKIFANQFLALRHINKHLLRCDEGAMWLLLCPCLSDVMKPIWKRTGNTRNQSAKIDEDRFQQLYHSYADCIEKAVSEGIYYDTVTTDGNSTYFLGLSGLLVVIQHGVVKTAYFPKFDECLGMQTPCKKISSKEKRERKVRKRARKKLLTKGSVERRIFQHGFRTSMKYFADCDSSNKSKEQYLELLHLAKNSMPCNYHDWKQVA